MVLAKVHGTEQQRGLKDLKLLKRKRMKKIIWRRHVVRKRGSVRRGEPKGLAFYKMTLLWAFFDVERQIEVKVAGIN
jgi:hypothetical protein